MTGTSEAFTTASRILPARGRSRMRALPSPLRTTLPTGQPMLTSMISQPEISLAFFAASAMVSGSLPKSCTPRGTSSGKRFSRVLVLASWSIRALAEIISLTA